MTSRPPSSSPATEWIMLTSSASTGRRSGRSGGSRAASMLLPPPRGPRSIRVGPPAPKQALARARRADEHEVVPAGRGDLERALGGLHPAHVLQVRPGRGVL